VESAEEFARKLLGQFDTEETMVEDAEYWETVSDGISCQVTKRDAQVRAQAFREAAEWCESMPDIGARDELSEAEVAMEEAFAIAADHFRALATATEKAKGE
jgi:hypothetical protein